MTTAANSATDLPHVLKRDNSTFIEWNDNKIREAIRKAAKDADREINGEFDNLLKAISDECTVASHPINGTLKCITVDEIQDIVKRKLMDYQFHDVAEQYIIFSNHKDELRKQRLDPDPDIISDLTTSMRYSRYDNNLKRREVWPEIVSRTEDMHIERYPAITKDLRWAFDKVRAKQALGSMRSMQFGGEAQKLNHAKGYNCSFSVCNRVEFFDECFWLLLSGTGTGYSVQFQHVDQLPALKFIDHEQVKHVVIKDTIEGWSEAVRELVHSYTKTTKYIEFSYHKLREKNAPLKTSGGRAPGHIPLRTALERVRGVLDAAQGRQLRPIECYDITCMLADAVYAGGIREAATICLFSIDDGEMMNAKTGTWFQTHPWRARSNNSVVLHRKNTRKRQFDRIFRATRQWGEPGFYFTDDEDTGANPCVEIGLNPKFEITPEIKVWTEQWAKENNKKIPKLKVGQVYWGWQMCNLSEVNCATAKTKEEFFDRIRAATIIGTAQAGFTDFPYLTWVSEAICANEALLGVSLTGMMDSPEIALDPETQRMGAQLAVEANMEISKKIGINAAARVTCVKPSGTASIVLGGVGAGIHPHHARRYFRRIRVNPSCSIYNHFKEHNPHMSIHVNKNKDLLIFPVKAPDGALTKEDLTATEFLSKVLSTQKNWVMPGTARPNSSPGVNHNVSNTIVVKDDEWDDVRELLWTNRKYFSGVSMLSWFGDKDYENAPFEKIINDADEALWQHLISNYEYIDWEQFNEEEDTTSLSAEAACAGGQCQL